MFLDAYHTTVVDVLDRLISVYWRSFSGSKKRIFRKYSKTLGILFLVWYIVSTSKERQNEKQSEQKPLSK